MAKLLACKICGEEFDPDHPKHKGGHFSICGDCEPKGRIDGNRTIGFFDVTGKSNYSLELIKDPTSAEKSMVKRLMRCGPTHCHTSLGLSSNGSTTPKDKMDRVHSKLYDEEQP